MTNSEFEFAVIVVVPIVTIAGSLEICRDGRLFANEGRSFAGDEVGYMTAG
jgi:hypothetical protein